MAMSCLNFFCSEGLNTAMANHLIEGCSVLLELDELKNVELVDFLAALFISSVHQSGQSLTAVSNIIFLNTLHFLRCAFTDFVLW